VRVVVAGAGFAGLLAAHRVARAGHEVVVLEARDRVPGRVHVPDRGHPRRGGKGSCHRGGHRRHRRIHAAAVLAGGGWREVTSWWPGTSPGAWERPSGCAARCARSNPTGNRCGCSPMTAKSTATRSSSPCPWPSCGPCRSYRRFPGHTGRPGSVPAWQRAGLAHNAKLHLPLTRPAVASAVQSVPDRFWRYRGGTGPPGRSRRAGQVGVPGGDTTARTVGGPQPGHAHHLERRPMSGRVILRADRHRGRRRR
jgi:NAD(P)-binding Rossmann-like domain